jgi:hypothetical protein
VSAAVGRAARHLSLRPSTLRGRLAMLSGVAVFVAITFAGRAAFAVASRVITDEVDASLTASADQLPVGPAFDAAQICTAIKGSSVSVPTSFLFELLQPDGSVCGVPGRTAIVITDADKAMARTGAGADVRQGTTVDGQELRVRVSSLPGGYAIITARSLDATHEVLRRLRGILFLLSIVGAFAARASAWSWHAPGCALLAGSPEPSRTWRAPRISTSRSRSQRVIDTTRLPGSQTPSTPWSPPSPRLAPGRRSSSLMPDTSCAPRSPACGPTWTCSFAASEAAGPCPLTSARHCCPALPPSCGR